jgi:hypothetical protein
MIRVSRDSPAGVRCIAVLLGVLVALAGAATLAACGSSGTTASGASPTGARTVAITAGLPQDAATEPPWNGRFVQATVRAPDPTALAADDWSVFVNGKEQELEKPADINAFAPDAATVVFILRAPFGEIGKKYRFRVVYSPPKGPPVKRSWDYDWTP